MKALPTTFRGVIYRSRTEARWAAFFGAMAWPADYEREGFDLDGTWYLADFWLPRFALWIEIKGEKPTDEEIGKCRRLASASGKRVWLIVGTPAAHSVLEFPNGEGSGQSCIRDCRRCDRAVLFWQSTDASHWQWEEIGERCARYDCGDRLPGLYGRVKDAIAAASNERFGIHDDAG